MAKDYKCFVYNFKFSLNNFVLGKRFELLNFSSSKFVRKFPPYFLQQYKNT